MIAEDSSLRLTEEATFSSFSLCERRSFRTLAPFGMWIMASRNGPFLIAPSVWLVDVDCDGVGKGGSRLLTPDLVVMAKFGASGSGKLLFPIVERIWENWDLFDQVLEMDPGAFYGFIDPLFELEDHVSTGREELGQEFSCKVLRRVEDSVLVSLEEDASSS
ncbi:hypothetical protein Tco_0758315 [Tanacetum coccineum]